MRFIACFMISSIFILLSPESDRDSVTGSLTSYWPHINHWKMRESRQLPLFKGSTSKLAASSSHCHFKVEHQTEKLFNTHSQALDFVRLGIEPQFTRIDADGLFTRPSERKFTEKNV